RTLIGGCDVLRWGSSLCHRGGVVDRQPLVRTAALGRAVTSSRVDEDAPHHARGDREEVTLVLPLRPPLIHETQICLVDQRRGAQGVIASFAMELPVGDRLELGV